MNVATYVIGPGDQLQISVCKNPELSTTTVPVRPDGRISTPLATDVVAAGRTPEELGKDIEARLKKYVSDPVVTVIVSSFVGPYSQQVRIVGEAAQPKALSYLAHMTVLDEMIASGGLTPFASGNRARSKRQHRTAAWQYNYHPSILLLNRKRAFLLLDLRKGLA